jgi:hypothetical protein
MMWLIWRQHRKQAYAALVALTLLAAILIPSGITIRRSFVDTGLAGCLDNLGPAEFVPLQAADACDSAAETFKNLRGNGRSSAPSWYSCRCWPGCSGVRRWSRGRSSRGRTT